jgi:lysophospholipase L1-like esterase
LEADRISYFLRKQFQQRFGGGGIGFVPLNPVIPINPTVNMTMSSGWEYSTALVKEEQRNPKPVGHLLSNAVLPANISNAWIKIDRRTLKAYSPLQFTQIKLLFSNYDAERVIEICTPTQTLYRKIAFPESAVQEIVADVGNTHEPITIKVQGSGRIALYGVAMDNNKGIALDNIPLRASAGLDFVKADVNILKQCYKELNVKLIILQFGVNVVPHQTTNYKYYENQIYKQLKQLQMAASYTPILVVGVSDIARRNANGVWASYPNVEKVRDAQRNAAFRANCAFWDTYQAMGGENSIISWASARPALATKDFCHFSPNGIQLLSELLYRSLMDDFITYYTAK